MTLDKAIELLANYLGEVDFSDDLDVKDAIQLNIEATKRFKRLREVIRVPYTELLPGEEPQ